MYLHILLFLINLPPNDIYDRNFFNHAEIAINLTSSICFNIHCGSKSHGIRPNICRTCFCPANCSVLTWHGLIKSLEDTAEIPNHSDSITVHNCENVAGVGFGARTDLSIMYYKCSM